MEYVIEKYGIYLKYVEETDADFILKLRTNKNKSKFINPTSDDIQLQKEWIKNYKKREKAELEYYFIAFDKNNEPFATYRLYNRTKKTIEIGSFITKENYLNPISAIKLDIVMKEFAFETLNYDKLNFEVRKMNFSVVKYHKEYEPNLYKEDELNYYFIQKREKFNLHKGKFKKLFKR
ncbi:GNAT family N-acetyltransferase [Polaribacter sp.]|nr:GNAT family N-acetyltransferase [Polaribacter sp.]